MDQAKVTGIINTISINFSTPPIAEEPEIWLFTLMQTKTASSPNTFQIIAHTKLRMDTTIIKRKPGKQTFYDIKLPIREGAYLGIRFSPGAGNPFAIERNQYYRYFDGEPYKNQALEFTRCQTGGIAMTYEIQPKIG